MTKKYYVTDNAQAYLTDDPPMEAAMMGAVDFIVVDVNYNDDGTIHILGMGDYREDKDGFLQSA